MPIQEHSSVRAVVVTPNRDVSFSSTDTSSLAVASNPAIDTEAVDRFLVALFDLNPDIEEGALDELITLVGIPDDLFQERLGVLFRAYSSLDTDEDDSDKDEDIDTLSI